MSAHHTYMGECPDALRPDARDPECPACRALDQAVSLEAAARAVLARWDSPSWSWDKGSHTADLVHALRAALGEPVQAGDAQPDQFNELRTARGAIVELERQVFALQQRCELLRICVDQHQRDAADPPGYLQDAVIRAAGLGAMATELETMRRKAAAPMKRLTESQIADLIPTTGLGTAADALWFARAVERALAEANGMKLEDTQ